MTRFQRYKKNFDSLRQIFFATHCHSLSDRNYMKSYDCRRKKIFTRRLNTTIIHCTFNYTLFRINTGTRLVITLKTFKLNLVYYKNLRMFLRKLYCPQCYWTWHSSNSNTVMFPKCNICMHSVCLFINNKTITSKCKLIRIFDWQVSSVLIAVIDQ